MRGQEVLLAFFAGFSLLAVVIGLALALLIIVSLWRLFEKAGYEGWKSIIPFYNNYILCEMATGNGLWFLGYFIVLIPFAKGFFSLVAFAFNVMIMYKIAKSFGRDSIYTIGLVFLPIVFFPLLAFGDAEYEGPQPIDVSRFTGQ